VTGTFIGGKPICINLGSTSVCYLSKDLNLKSYKTEGDTLHVLNVAS